MGVDIYKGSGRVAREGVAEMGWPLHLGGLTLRFGKDRLELFLHWLVNHPLTS